MTRFLTLLRWIVFLLAAFALNFPLIATLVAAFKSEAEIAENPSLLIEAPTLENFAKVFEISDRFDIAHYLVNSLIAASLGSLFAILLSFPAAYAIVRQGVGQRWLLPGVTNLRAIPLIIFSIPIYLIYQRLALLDTRFGLALILCLVNLPLVLVLVANAVRDLPIEIEEAALVDGASTFYVLWRVVLPLTAPAIASSLILAFIYAWNEFLFGLMLTTQSAVPITVGASFFFAASGGGVQWGTAAAVMILSVLPPLLLSLLAYRYIGRSLTAGAVKG
ncbi:carbohydrate ABC transporter permease [Labrys neptuniae]|uniref:carbohydrate ABC transporter permease n=1 Tax=Labrys TaxID=204476 RepID=UPI002890213D|nr:carbohydrate ABC transporter permease [Labrys neptuniae]MDT3377049.1 carbohydrate ABC transporter permease [Labrys neptuniae]